MKKGFTLIEVMLVVGLMLAVGFLASSFSGSFMAQSAISDATSQFRSAFDEAHAYAVSGRQNSSWSVHYSGATITLFKGDSYDQRDPSYDEQTKINSHIDVSGLDEITFARPDGRPNHAVADLKLSWDSMQIADFSINSEGIVQ